MLADTLAQARELLGRGASEEYLAYTERAAARFPRSAAVRLEYATAVGAFDPERARAEALEIAALEFDHELERCSSAPLACSSTSVTRRARASWLPARLSPRRRS